MKHRKRSWKGRAPSDSTSVFEQALFEGESSHRKPFDARTDRKTLQLCRQVERALMLALAGECGDEILRQVSVDSVEPMGSAAQLIVSVRVPADVATPSHEVIARLNERSSRLRRIVAESISRKRTPALSFIAIPAHSRHTDRGQS